MMTGLRYRLLTVLLLLVLLLFPHISEASLSCYQCHGTDNPPDLRPLDSVDRDAATGGFTGNHRTHMDGTATVTTCNRCHPGSDTKTSGHRTGYIKISSHMNASALVTTYRNMTSAWRQTPLPLLDANARCANVNCHFETVSPPWGSASFTSSGECSACHGAPPSSTAYPFPGGAAGSHTRHNLYYAGPTRCGRCHPDHLAEGGIFSHATSAGRRGIAVQPRDPASVAYGWYSAGSHDGSLPSQAPSHLYGSCANIYCHSNGTSLATGSIPANVTPVWGSGSTTCTSCHGMPPAYPSNAPKANTHGKHPFGCVTCHAATTADGATVADFSRHVNGVYDVVAGNGVAFSYAFSGGKGTCSNITCHNGGTAVWGTTLLCGDCHATSPGGD